MLDPDQEAFNLARAGLGAHHVDGSAPAKTYLSVMEPFTGSVLVLQHLLREREQPSKPVDPVADGDRKSGEIPGYRKIADRKGGSVQFRSRNVDMR